MQLDLEILFVKMQFPLLSQTKLSVTLGGYVVYQR